MTFLLSRPVSRLLFSSLLCLPWASACGGEDAEPAVPTTFGVAFSQINGEPPSQPTALRCDGLLPVELSLKSDPENKPFALRPASACGTSTRCGYIHIEALGDSDEVLAQVDTVTTAGVLELPPERLADVRQLKVTLIRGVDSMPLLNPDRTPVAALWAPSFEVPTRCGVEGAGGAGGASSRGGAGGDSALAPGGAPADPAAMGGAAGEGMLPSEGGAGGS